MRTVTMPIKRKWFDMIRSGEKKEEYRTIGNYWRKRLLENKVKCLKLINGYGRDRPYIIVELRGIKEGVGRKEWGAVPGEIYFVLELGYVIDGGNL